MTIVGFVSGRSGALLRHVRAILITSIKPAVDNGTLFSIGHILTLKKFRMSIHTCYDKVVYENQIIN